MHEIFPSQKRAGDLTGMRESLAECVRVVKKWAYGVNKEPSRKCSYDVGVKPEMT